MWPGLTASWVRIGCFSVEELSAYSSHPEVINKIGQKFGIFFCKKKKQQKKQSFSCRSSASTRRCWHWQGRQDRAHGGTRQQRNTAPLEYKLVYILHPPSRLSTLPSHSRRGSNRLGAPYRWTMALIKPALCSAVIAGVLVSYWSPGDTLRGIRSSLWCSLLWRVCGYRGCEGNKEAICNTIAFGRSSNWYLVPVQDAWLLGLFCALPEAAPLFVSTTISNKSMRKGQFSFINLFENFVDVFKIMDDDGLDVYISMCSNRSASPCMRRITVNQQSTNTKHHRRRISTKHLWE